MSLNQVQFPPSVSSDQEINSSQTKLEAVANFISQYEAPELREISEQQNPGSVPDRIPSHIPKTKNVQKLLAGHY